MSKATVSPAARLICRLGAIVRRIVPTILIILIGNFFLLRAIPGDAADMLVGETGTATAESIAQLRAHLGVDVPVTTQLLNYFGNLAHFNLGFSPHFNASVTEVLLSRLPSTLLLMGAALILSLVAGIGIGIVQATWRGRWPDALLTLLTSFLYSAPGFWIGLMLIAIVSVRLGWLPSAGAATVGENLAGLDAWRDRFGHLILPAIALSSHYLAIYARITRSTMVELASLDFVRAARAKGADRFTVVMGHILPNAWVPITTVAALNLGGLLGGAAAVEIVFGWPGLGSLALDAVVARDHTVLLGILLISSFVVICGNVLIDLLQAWLDPRLQIEDVR